jgi:hypothetical protein
MNRHFALAVIAVMCLGLFCSFSTLNQAQAQGKKAADSAEPKITVFNPLGVAPAIKLKPMAPRLNTLDGKTIYLVDNGYLGSDNLLKEMIVWLEKEYPKANFVFKRLGLGSGSGTEQLFAEVREKADAVIMGVGH